VANDVAIEADEFVVEEQHLGVGQLEHDQALVEYFSPLWAERIATDKASRFVHLHAEAETGFKRSVVRRAATNPTALVVKLADVTDNINIDRIPNPSDIDIARLNEYKQVKDFLEKEAVHRRTTIQTHSHPEQGEGIIQVIKWTKLG